MKKGTKIILLALLISAICLIAVTIALGTASLSQSDTTIARIDAKFGTGGDR